MSELVRIEDIKPLEGHWLRLWFSNGAVKDVDFFRFERRTIREPAAV